MILREMGNKSSQSETTPKKEPRPAGVSSAPPVRTALVEMAWQVAIPFMVLVLGGNWLDGKYDTGPLFAVIGVFLGVAAVTAIVYRLVERHFPGTLKKEDK